jgi:cysteine-rich repeat protein
MMRATPAVLAVWLVSACLAPSAVVCGDGRTCPAGSTCDDLRSLCLTEAQTTACNGIGEGKPCDAEGTPGICDRGFCEPGCGDGLTGPDEECDDGNFASHDGCSSRCAVEVPSWSQQAPTWHGLTYPGAVYHQALGRIVVYGGFDANGGSTTIWQIDPARMYEVEGGWVDVSGAFAPTERPPQLRGMAVAYDPVRAVLVMHGGDDIEGTVHGETWEYAAGGGMYGNEPVGVWRQVIPTTPTATPGPLWPPNMAFDSRLGKIVLHGGKGPGGVAGTWVYDGAWTQLDPTVEAEVPQRPSLAFDQTRQALVTFTSSSSDATIKTFEFSGTTWVEQTGLTPSPPRRQGAMFAYHPGLAKLVLFGGQTTVTTGLEVLADTWLYDGTWQQLGGVSPPGRRTGVLVTDPVNQSVWLFGGSKTDGTAPYEDVWELTTTDGWVQRTPRFGPPTGYDATAAYSRDDHSVMIVGGGNFLELWSHDGVRWRHEPDASVARTNARLAYDSDQRRYILTGGKCVDADPDCTVNDKSPMTYALDADTRTWSKLGAVWPSSAIPESFGFVYEQRTRRFVAFGGASADGIDDDTWILDGTSWSELASPERPASTLGSMMTYDSDRGTTVLFDGAGDTWELQGSGWMKLIDHEVAAMDPGVRLPEARYAGAMIYDPSRKRHVLVGGIRNDGLQLADVWELDVEARTWSEVIVVGTTPLPRHKFVLARHDNMRATMLYGGSAGSLFARNDVWFLRYTSTTPDEVCTDGMDTDGDRQLDDEDPDCDPPP